MALTRANTMVGGIVMSDRGGGVPLCPDTPSSRGPAAPTQCASSWEFSQVRAGSCGPGFRRQPRLWPMLIMIPSRYHYEVRHTKISDVRFDSIFLDRPC
jgi:hypothetical protein